MSSVSAISGSSAAVRSLAPLAQGAARVRAISPVKLPSNDADSLRAQQRDDSQAASARDSRTTAVRDDQAQAAAVAQAVLAPLEQLSATIQAAAATPGTSRANLQSDAQRLVVAVDTAVRRTTADSASPVADESRDVRATTDQGGRVAAAAQALDSKGLGLSGLDLTTDTGIQDALSRIDNALNVAKTQAAVVDRADGAANGQKGFAADLNLVVVQATAGLAAPKGYDPMARQVVDMMQGPPKGSVLDVSA
jgi:hypothetical protein